MKEDPSLWEEDLLAVLGAHETLQLPPGGVHSSARKGHGGLSGRADILRSAMIGS